MRRSITACFVFGFLIVITGCGGGGGGSAGTNPTTTTIQTAPSSPGAPPPTSATDVVLTTPSSTITVPVSALTGQTTFAITETPAITSDPPNLDASLASPVIRLSSPDVVFAPGAAINVSITPTTSASPDLLVLRHSSGVFLCLWLPSATQAARAGPRATQALTVKANWLNLPGSVELALYHFGGRVNPLALYSDNPTGTSHPQLVDRYRLLIHGVNADHRDMEPLRLSLHSLGLNRAELSVDYDETQRADVAATAIVNLLDQPNCPLVGSSANLQIIGYSYGGDVARLVAKELKARGSQLQIDSVVTINTPNAGAPVSASLLASLTLTATNGRGRRWTPNTAALHTISGDDGVLTALNADTRTYAWSRVGGTAFPGLPRTTDLTTEFLRFAGNLLYPTTQSDGMVADWSSLPPVPFGAPATFDYPQSDRQHVSVMAFTNTNALCRFITALFGEGGLRISRGDQWAPLNGICYLQPSRPSLSGRYQPYESDQTNNTAGDTNGRRDIYLYDCALGTTELISVLSDGSQMNGTSRSASCSFDGRIVIFASNNTRSLTGEQLTHWNVYLRDRVTRTTTCLTVNAQGSEIHSDDAGDSDRWDLGIAMTPDANVVAYAAFGPDGYTHIYRLDRRTNSRTLLDVSPANQLANWNSNHPTIADDGNRIGFQTLADNLDNSPVGSLFGHEKVYVWDILTALTLASVHPNGTAPTTDAQLPMLSGDGSSIIYSSADPNLTDPPAPAGSLTTFIRRLATNTTEIVSVDETGQAMAGFTAYGSLDRTGRYASFTRWTDQSNPAGPSNVWIVDLSPASRRSMCLTVNAAGQPNGGTCYWPTLASSGINLHFASLTTSFDPSNTTGIMQDYVVANPFLLLPSMTPQPPPPITYRTHN